jgi:outer membrane lipoprotein SlyB
MNKKYLFPLLISCLICGGCAEKISPNVYTADEVGTMSHVVPATVISIRQIEIDNPSGAGGLAGTAAGAVAGSGIGGGAQANIIGGIGGAVVGGLVGAAIDEGVHKKQGIEYILRLENKSLVSVAQLDKIDLHVGQHVLIIYGERTRIIPDSSYQTSRDNSTPHNASTK